MKSAFSLSLLLAMLSVVSAGTTSFTFHAGKFHPSAMRIIWLRPQARSARGRLLGRRILNRLTHMPSSAVKIPSAPQKKGKPLNQSTSTLWGMVEGNTGISTALKFTRRQIALGTSPSGRNMTLAMTYVCVLWLYSKVDPANNV
jgi:hypothetical protein